MTPAQISSVCAQCRRSLYQKYASLMLQPISKFPSPRALSTFKPYFTEVDIIGRPKTSNNAVFSGLLASLNFKSGPKADTSAFTECDPKNEMVTTQAAPLQEALDAGDVGKAWAIFKGIGDPRKNEFFYRFLRSSHILSKLFQSILENEKQDPRLPALLDLVSTYRNLRVMCSSDYARLLVKLLRDGDINILGAMLEFSCEISAPVQRALNYVNNIAYNPFGDSEIAAQVFEDEEMNLWVVIYAVYHYLRMNNAQPNTPFWKALDASIPSTPLPPIEVIVQALSGYGFGPEFYQPIVRSSSAFEATTASIANLISLRKQLKGVVERQDAMEIMSLYEEGREAIPHLLTGRHYDLFISAFMALKLPKPATTVWNEMVLAGIEPTQFTWNALLTGCARADDIRSLSSVWQKMIETGVKPDTYCWTTRVHALFLTDKVRDGLMCLQEMSERGAKPNVNTINAAMDGLLRHHRLSEAQAVLKIALNKYAIKPDIVTYNTLLRGLMKQGAFDEANNVLVAMEQQNIRPDVVTCTIILNGVYKHALSASNTSAVPAIEMCEELLTQMKEAGIEANVNTYTVLIDGLLGSENLSAAIDVFAVMQQRNIKPTAATYTLFIIHYFKHNDFEAVEKCWTQLLSQNVIPDKVLFEYTIRGYARYRPQINTSPGVSRYATDRMIHWVKKASEMSTKRLEGKQKARTGSEGERIEQDTTNSKLVNVKISYITYKEVLGRLIEDQELEIAETVLADVSRRLAEDGPLVIPFAMHHLRGVLKVLSARGIQIPSAFKLPLS